MIIVEPCVELTFLQHLEIMSEIDVGQVLDDDVESLAADVLHHLLLVVLVVVVEHVVRATFGDEVHAILSAGSADYGRSESSAIAEFLAKSFAFCFSTVSNYSSNIK